eukprot:TRINITY_DN4631_c0_g1_i1.p2 TRINITY_DN4631_c0_g1~~TRINITY_DN4631_c0_g1_i1.p2  ORF type:complete len:519 (+),score=79.96 TRINITY_DN4631_c0_g1_i1:88-1644(+)
MSSRRQSSIPTSPAIPRHSISSPRRYSRASRKSISEVVHSNDIRRDVELDMLMVMNRLRQSTIHESIETNDDLIDQDTTAPEGSERGETQTSSVIYTGLATSRSGEFGTPHMRKKLNWMKQKAQLLHENEPTIARAHHRNGRKLWIKLSNLTLRSQRRCYLSNEEPRKLDLITIMELHKINDEFVKRSANGQVNMLQFAFSLASVVLVPFSELLRTFRSIDAAGTGFVTYSSLVTFLYNKYKMGITDVQAREAFCLANNPVNDEFSHIGIIDRVIFVPDLGYYMTCSRDSSIKIWDVSSQDDHKHVIIPIPSTKRLVLNVDQMSSQYEEPRRSSGIYSAILESVEGSDSRLSSARTSVIMSHSHTIGSELASNHSHQGSPSRNSSTTFDHTHMKFRRKPDRPKGPQQKDKSAQDQRVQELLKSQPVISHLRPPPPPPNASEVMLARYVRAVKAAAESAADATLRQKKGTDNYIPSHIRVLTSRKRKKLNHIQAVNWPLDIGYCKITRRLFAAYSGLKF